MTATRAKTPPRVDTSRTYADHLTVNGRRVERGDELTVKGIRRRTRKNPDGVARVAFVDYVQHADGAEWVDVIHGATGRSRSVRPDAIRRVHRRRTGITGR